MARIFASISSFHGHFIATVTPDPSDVGGVIFGGSFLRTETHLSTLFFSLERDIALSIGRVPERDDFSEIIVQKETALKDLELETAKLVRRLLKDAPGSSLQLSLSVPRGSVHAPCLCGYRNHSCLVELCDTDVQGMGKRLWFCPRSLMKDPGALN